MSAERPAPAPQRRPDDRSADHLERLRHLAGTSRSTAAARDATRMIDPHGLDQKTAALVRLAALVALGAGPTPYRRCVDVALAAGANVDDVVDTLRAVAPCVGLARVVSAAPGVALAVGYDIDSALETLDVPRAGDAAGPSRAGDGGFGRRRTAEDPVDGPGEASRS